MLKKIRYSLEAIALLILLGLSKCLPADWASALGGWIGRTIGPRLAASRKALKNISRNFPELSEDAQKEILTSMWDNLGRVIMEYAHIPFLARQRTRIIHDEKIKIFQNKSAVFISAHMGNWECCPPAFALQYDYPVNPVYRPPNNPFVDWMLNKARAINKRLKPIPKSKGGTRTILEILKSGEGVGMLIDQKYNEGVEALFFGRPAMTSPAFAQLAQKFNCPLIPLQIRRVKNTVNFEIIIHDPIPVTDRPVDDIIAETHALFERWIREEPGQWLWLHRRWKD